jgi:hypothetical protein
MTTITVTTYGPGGYDPTKPNGNVIAVETCDAPPQVDQPTADDKLAAASSALAAIDSATTVSDIVTILSELKQALEQ